MNFSAFVSFCDNEKIEYKLQEPMRFYTSFKIGGPAEVMVFPENEEELIKILKKADLLGLPIFILGKGSNLLVSDNGVKKIVINLSNLSEISVVDGKIKAGAGASLAAVCNHALSESLTGLEFAFGIPGGVGGAVFMNAGAYGGEMSQVVKEAEYITVDGKRGTISLEDMKLGYRTSIFKNSNMIITSVTFALLKGEKEEIKNKMQDYMNRRKEKQPLEYPSAGSTFKRPEGYFAGALIEKNNLKGKQIGGAMVSKKHAGFVINYQNATADDVKKLMDYVRGTVFEADGVELEPEVIFVE